MMLDLYKLQIFAVVVQEGSFSAAADRLYMTQSAISQHVHDLEAALGVRLFVRGWRGVTLTAQGETLHDYARRIFALVAEAENAVTDVDHLHTGQITLGATPGVGVYLLPDWTQAFRSRYPNLTVSIQTGVTAHIIRDILSNRLDAGLIEGELEENRSARLQVVVLQQVEQFVVVGPGHPWWDSPPIPLAALNGQAFIMRPRNSQTRIWLDGVLSEHNIQPVVNAEFDNLESIKRSVTGGSCVTILPEYVLRQEEELGTLRRVAVVDSPLQRELKLIWDRDTIFSPVTSAFMRHLCGVFPHLAERLKL